jgi:hypothetical protein
VEADDVKLEEPIRRVDTFTVPVALAADLRTEIKVWVVREKKEGEAAAEGQAAEGAEGSAEAGTEGGEEASQG